MQHFLPFPSITDAIAMRLEGSLGFSPKVILTNNRHSVLSIKHEKGGAILRMHTCFASAPDDVIDAIAGFVKKRTRQRGNIIGKYFESQKKDTENEPTSRKRLLNADGKCYDLAGIMRDLNERFFKNTVDARITWGKGGTRRRYMRRKSRHITLGSYNRHEKIIAIHPNLDKPDVPLCVVESIVFHEMCHQVIGTKIKNGRRKLHTKEFKDLELGYPNFTEAKKWARENMDKLLRKDKDQGLSRNT